MQARQKQAEYRENQIGVDFVTCPPDQYTRVFITGEILSACGFAGEQIFIEYKWSLPHGWKAEVPEELKNLGLSEIEMEEINCLSSITHSVGPILKSTNQESYYEHYFSFPFDLQLLAKEKAISQNWPTLHFQVFEKDQWDRVYMHGCGFIKLPNHPGTHLLQSDTWRPQLDNRSQIAEFFLGGLVRPKEVEDISRSFNVTEMDKSGPINRSLFNTISSGKVKVRFNIATQSKKVKSEERVNYKSDKFAEQTEFYKEEYSKSHIPSQVNTGTILGARYTNTKLNFN